MIVEAILLFALEGYYPPVDKHIVIRQYHVLSVPRNPLFHREAMLYTVDNNIRPFFLKKHFLQPKYFLPYSILLWSRQITRIHRSGAIRN